MPGENKSNTQNEFLGRMDEWPKSWAGTSDDISFGQGLVSIMKPFIIQLYTRKFTAKTIRRHFNHLWVIGGEIIREINDYPQQRKKLPEQLLAETIKNEQAPYIRDFSESEQRALDSTARKLRNHLLKD